MNRFWSSSSSPESVSALQRLGFQHLAGGRLRQPLAAQRGAGGHLALAHLERAGQLVRQLLVGDHHAALQQRGVQIAVADQLLGLRPVAHAPGLDLHLQVLAGRSAAAATARCSGPATPTL